MNVCETFLVCFLDYRLRKIRDDVSSDINNGPNMRFFCFNSLTSSFIRKALQ